MAVIQFTAADALQTTVVPSDIYPSEVTKITGPQKSSSEKSVNYIVDIAITDGKYKGKTRTVMFNSGMNNSSMMGDMQFFPQQAFLKLDAAVRGLPDVNMEDFKDKPMNLDLDTLLHKPIDVSWGIATVDGHMTNTINSFHPKGYGASAPAF